MQNQQDLVEEKRFYNNTYLDESDSDSDETPEEIQTKKIAMNSEDDYDENTLDDLKIGEKVSFIIF